MAEVKKSDILYIQNELLGDIAKLDKKLSDKITQLTSALQYQKLTSDQKYELTIEKYNLLLSKFEDKEDFNKLKEQFTDLYPNENISEADAQSMTDELISFFALCLKIAEQQESLQEVQGNQQNNVQNVDNLR